MRIGPFDLTRRKAVQADLLTHWPTSPSGWWPVLREGFAGAWQRSITAPIEDALSHPTFWSCVTLIAGDIAKMRPMLKAEDADGICDEIVNASYTPVIRRPNHYQNRIQFYSYWALAKLTRGNAYALKERNHRGGQNQGNVTALYLLDPSRVRPLVTPNGDVYYALQQDVLAGLTEANLVVPASEIIHDVMYAPYHPLCGLSPIAACGASVMQSLRIMSKSTRFFANDAMLGGLLVAPGQISTDTAQRLEAYWNTNYAGEENVGKIAAIGDGLKFEKPTRMSAIDAQLIDQLKWNDEKVCSVFHVPPYMVGVGAMPNYNNIESLNQQYYSQCLQILVESLELCLSEGLELNDPYSIEFDLDGLLRMDSATKMKAATDGVKGMIYTPNEARQMFNKPPIAGGDTVYGQEQDHALEWLTRRDAQPIAPPAPATPPPAAPPEPPADPSAPTKSIGDVDDAEMIARLAGSLLAHELTTVAA